MKLNLWQKVLIGMVLGLGCGYLCGDCYAIAKPIATIYMNLVKMIVVPTVFFAILYGITNISDINMLGRLGVKATGIYGLATMLAVGIGIAFAILFKPGIGVNFNFIHDHGHNLAAATSSTANLTDIIVNMFPDNPIGAMVNGNVLQVVVFAFILGLAMLLAGEKAREAKKVIVSITAIIFKMVELVIKLTPYGVFAIMIWVLGEYGFTLVVSLGKLALVIMGAFLLQYALFGLMLLTFRLNPVTFYKKTSNIQSVAFATSSSKATIMTAITELQERVGVSERAASFILPLGAAINMTGSAIYIAVCALFFAQIAGVELTYYQYAVLVLTSTIGSIGAAGYPSGGVIMLSMVLASVGLPIDGIPLIMAIDRFTDMFRTVINVTGDCTVTVMVDKLEGTLNLEKYHNQS